MLLSGVSAELLVPRGGQPGFLFHPGSEGCKCHSLGWRERDVGGGRSLGAADSEDSHPRLHGAGSVRKGLGSLSGLPRNRTDQFSVEREKTFRLYLSLSECDSMC